MFSRAHYWPCGQSWVIVTGTREGNKERANKCSAWSSAMLRKALQCWGKLCNAEESSAMLRKALQCWGKLCNAEESSAMLRKALQCLRKAMQCYTAGWGYTLHCFPTKNSLTVGAGICTEGHLEFLPIDSRRRLEWNLVEFLCLKCAFIILLSYFVASDSRLEKTLH